MIDATLMAGFPKPVKVLPHSRKPAPPPRIPVEPVRITLTDHARKRGKERLNLRGAALQKRAEDAWWRGLMAHEATGELACWLATKQKINPSANATRVYGGFAFLFHNEVLITMLQVPESHLPKATAPPPHEP